MKGLDLLMDLGKVSKTEHNVINEHDARAIKVIKYLFIGLQKTDKGV